MTDGEILSDMSRLCRLGEVEGVLKFSEGGLFNGRWCLEIGKPDPELSDGVGGSPLLHAMEQ